MERRKFFSLLGTGVAAVVVSKSLVSCAKNPLMDGAPQNVDFTLDLTNATYSGLKTKGAAVYNGGVIIAHTSSDTYIALSQVCTHQGCTVQFNGSNGFVCPCHGATYASDGSVTGGPAPAALRKYNISLVSNSLHVYS